MSRLIVLLKVFCAFTTNKCNGLSFKEHLKKELSIHTTMNLLVEVNLDSFLY